MARTISVRSALREFVSTFREWHYFSGGFAIGFVAGFMVAVSIIHRLFRAYRANDGDGRGTAGRRPTHQTRRRGWHEQ